MFPFVSSLLSLGAPNRFSSVWDANLKTAVAPRFAETATTTTTGATTTTSSPDYPAHCKLAVVGAGWGGAYFAWRMAVDTKTVDAKDVCVFEANGRVGGRIYSIHGLPNFADLAVDVGGYRFQEVQKLPADLVFSALKLPTLCYDWQCASQCEGNTCYVIKDAYGNNAGYATGIETMLGQVEDEAGPQGHKVYFASRLTSIESAPLVSASASKLKFANGKSVTADRVLLNLPGNAITNLTSSSLIFTKSPANTSKALESVSTFHMVKVYAWYEDAWWNSKLGLMEGYFNTNARANDMFDVVAPLEGRYHDGPQRCLIGKDTAGMPVWSGNKVKGGNCSGAIEVFYGGGKAYYKHYMSGPLQPLTVVTAQDAEKDDAAAVKAGRPKPSQLLKDVHEALMAYHAPALKAAGVDPESVGKPMTVVMGNWIEHGTYTPGIGRLQPGTDKEKALVRKPAPGYEVYVVNQDYGYHSGWAVGSLTMAEKVLQAEIGLPKPTWLDEAWYKTNVLGHA